MSQGGATDFPNYARAVESLDSLRRAKRMVSLPGTQVPGGETWYKKVSLNVRVHNKHHSSPVSVPSFDAAMQEAIEEKWDELSQRALNIMEDRHERNVRAAKSEIESAEAKLNSLNSENETEDSDGFDGSEGGDQ